MNAPTGHGKKQALSRQGRNAVLWGVGICLTLQLAFHYPLSYWIPQLQDVEYANKLRHLKAHLKTRTKEQPLVLGLGSSFTGMGLRPGVLEASPPNDAGGPLVYNFAMNSSGVLVQLLCLNRLLAEGIRPDWVLVEASPYFLFMHTNRAQDNEYLPMPRVQRRDVAVLSRYHGNAHQFRKAWREVQCLPWHSHRHLVQNWLAPTWVPTSKRIDHLWSHTDEWGWEAFPAYIARYKNFYRTPKFLADQRAFMDSLNKQTPSETIQNAFRELVDVCQRDNIGVVLIRVPESTYIRTAYSSDLNQKVERFYAQLSQATKIRIIDASAWVDDAEFVEGMHLAPAGATTYTHRLEQELLAQIFPTSRKR